MKLVPTLLLVVVLTAPLAWRPFFYWPWLSFGLPCCERTNPSRNISKTALLISALLSSSFSWSVSFGGERPRPEPWPRTAVSAQA